MIIADKGIYSSIESIPLKKNEILYEAGRTIRYAYFPTTAAISLISLMEDGATNEIITIGSEGMAGVTFLMGRKLAFNHAIVSSAGHAYRIDANLLAEKFNQSSTMQLLLQRYVQYLFAQMSQISTCNLHHGVRQKLCRWLLSRLDNQISSEFLLTHEELANFLGVRRESITKEAGELQNAGIVQNSRGHIAVLNRAKLEQHACECYAVIRHEASRLLKDFVFFSTTMRNHNSLHVQEIEEATEVETRISPRGKAGTPPSPQSILITP